MTAEIETAEDIEAKQLMEKWSKEIDTDDSSEVSELEDDGPHHYDEDLEKYRRDVDACDNALDNVVLGTSDLEKSIEVFEQMTGVKPVMVVSLKGLGTKSARVAFDECCFLEIVGPDLKQSQRPLGDKLVNIEPGKMVPLHYSIRSSKAADMQRTRFADMGFECDQVTMVAQDRGMPWKWDMFFLEGHDEGGLVPFFSNWNGAHHAAGRLPIVGSEPQVTVRAPSNSAIHKLVSGVDNIDAETGDEHFEFSFKSKKGTHTFSSSKMMGVAFPK